MNNSNSTSVSAPFTRTGPAGWQVVAAFCAVYAVWGATYLGIRYAVTSIPPFLMAGSRSVVAGLLLYGFGRVRGAFTPTKLQWRDAAIAGGLLLTVGNGGVTWAEQVVPSGVTALVVALVPCWIVLLDWCRPGGVRPGLGVVAGLAMGIAGVALLTSGGMKHSDTTYRWGIICLMIASIGWAMGSVFNRHAQKPTSPLLAIAMQMIAGGVLLLVLAALHGEFRTFEFSHVSRKSIVAWLYLTCAGSLIGFTAYVWLLHVSTPARVSTYAYVNPLIAVLLGCTIGGESVSPRLFVAGALIILAVGLIVSSPSQTNSKRVVEATAKVPIKTTQT